MEVSILAAFAQMGLSSSGSWPFLLCKQSPFSKEIGGSSHSTPVRRKKAGERREKVWIAAFVVLRLRCSGFQGIQFAFLASMEPSACSPSKTISTRRIRR